MNIRRKYDVSSVVVLSVYFAFMLGHSSDLWGRFFSGSQEKAAESGYYRPINFDKLKSSGSFIFLNLRGYQQTTSYTCGPASALTLMGYYGRQGDELKIAEEMGTSKNKGTTPQQLASWLENNGFRVTWGENGSIDMLKENLKKGIPTLIEWIDYGGHWVVCAGYDDRGTEGWRDDIIIFADPADNHDDERNGITYFNAARFNAMWFDAFLFERPMYKVYVTAVPK